MKYGVNTLLWTAAFDTTHFPLLRALKEHGADGAEIARFEFETFPAAEVRRALENNGLECTFCTALSGDLSLVSDDASVRRRTTEFLKRAIQAAAEIGSPVLAGPFVTAVGLLPGRRRNDQEWKRAVEGLQSLTPTLAEYDITLAVEPLNRFEAYFLNTAADGAALCDEVADPRVGLLLDTFHANIEEKNIAAAFRSARRHLKHVHACENDRGAPGSGHVEWAEVGAALNETGYDDWLVIESFTPAIKEIATAACIWRDLAPTPEALAFDGLAFLKSHIR